MKDAIKLSFIVMILSSLISCSVSGKLVYTPPNINEPYPLVQKIVNKSKDELLIESDSLLRKELSNINGIDRSSDSITVNFDGSVEKYIDCGQANSTYQVMSGKKTYDFLVSNANYIFEFVFTSPYSGDKTFYQVNRVMNLNSRVIIILKEISKNKTNVSVSVSYIVKKYDEVNKHNYFGSFEHTYSDTISFRSGGHSSFPVKYGGLKTTCIANGDLEQEIMSMINKLES